MMLTPKGYRYTRTSVKVNIVGASMYSVLEAFRLYTADHSFAALAVQPTALPNIWTNGSSRTKLDYCRDNQFISRVKLTCLTCDIKKVGEEKEVR